MPLDFAREYTDPDVFLALSMSVPADTGLYRPTSEQLFSVESDSRNIRITVPRMARGLSGAQLLGSKETIAAALLLRNLYETRFEGEYEELRTEMLQYAHHTYGLSRESERGLLRAQSSKDGQFLPSFSDHLNVDASLIDDVDDLTHRVLTFLETEQLVIDPALTGSTGLMILFGLIPLRWSVRTPKGQQVYREIKVASGLWSLEIQKKRRGEKRLTDWDFRIRGVNVVKRVLKELAEEYLRLEERDRVDEGRPGLPAGDDVKVD
ncbi:MAG: hypothetical protein WBX00_19355 [Isosphaeraceae bacterium]